jgi:GNAT superfamily N-acetyltransferase
VTTEFSRFDFRTRLDDQRELSLDCFPEFRGTPAETKEFYRWKFQSLPSAPPSYEFVAESDGKLVGYYAALPYQYKIMGKSALIGMVCDVMTHSRARGQGVFTELGRFSLDQMKRANVDCVTGYPIRKEVIPGHLKTGWSVVLPMPMYMSVVGTKFLFSRLGGPGVVPIADRLVHGINKLIAAGRSNDAITKILSVEDFLGLEAYEAFVCGWSKDKTNYLLKTREFLRWRLSAPGASYKVVCAFRGPQLVAVAIARRLKLRGIESLALLDLMVLPGEESAVAAVTRRLRDLAREETADVVVVCMTKKWATSLRLLRCGFFPTPFVFKLIAQRLSKRVNDADVYTPDNWCLTWLDSDDL